MAEHAKIPVINAMTSENHPCEIITDLYALSKLYNDIENKKFLVVGAKGKCWCHIKSLSAIFQRRRGINIMHLSEFCDNTLYRMLRNMIAK